MMPPGYPMPPQPQQPLSPEAAWQLQQQQQMHYQQMMQYQQQMHMMMLQQQQLPGEHRTSFTPMQQQQFYQQQQHMMMANPMMMPMMMHPPPQQGMMPPPSPQQIPAAYQSPPPTKPDSSAPLDQDNASGSFVRVAGETPVTAPGLPERPPPPPQPGQEEEEQAQPKKRVVAEFLDAPATDPELMAHASVMEMDLEDLHEFDENHDLAVAALERAEDRDAQDAGIIERGTTVVPALPVSQSGNETTMVQATNIEPTLQEEEEAEEENATTGEKTPKTANTFATNIFGAAIALLGSSFRMMGTSRTEESLQQELGQAKSRRSSTAAAAAATTAAAAAAVPTIVEEAAPSTTEPQQGGEEAVAAASNSEEAEEQATVAPTSTEDEAAAAAVAPPPPPAIVNPNIIDVEVRTLSGKEAIFSQLDSSKVTLGELREMIFERFPGISVEDQRLLLKSKLLEILDPALTLLEADVRQGDVIRLVRQLQAPPAASSSSRPSSVTFAQPPVLAPAAAPEPLQILTVLVPPGRGPGDRLRITPQGRGAMIVTVPEGLGAGDRFRVMLPPDDPAELFRAEQALAEEQRRIMEEEEMAARNRAANSRPQIMAVVMPRGMKAGQMMDVNVPGRGRVRVPIPKGVKAGQQFKFRLPAINNA